MTSGGEAGPPPEWSERFGGVERLWGRDGARRIGSGRVMVVGLGGVGSWTVEALARSGVGALVMVDMDDVCITNTNRQLHALEGTIGRAKGEVLAERVKSISPSCAVTVVAEFFTERSADRLLSLGADVVVDAIDQADNKARLVAGCRARGVPVIVSGGAGGRREPWRVQAGDLGETAGDGLLREVRRTLRREHGWSPVDPKRWDVPAVFSAERPVYPSPGGGVCARPEVGGSLRISCDGALGSAAPVTGTFGLVAAGLALRILTGSP